ncbi:MAG: urease accessory UreF family protein [Synechococcales cyanobacterium]
MAIALVNPLLFLLQISDSALPIGAYSHSWGIEAAVQHGRLTSAAQVKTYLEGMVRYAGVPLDGQACVLAHHYSRQQDVAAWFALQQHLSASRWASESHQASLHLGKRLHSWGEKHWGIPCPHGPEVHHSAVFGWLCAQAGVDLPDTVTAYLWSMMVAWVTAAVKLVPLGQSDGQRLLVEFHGQLDALVADLLTTPVTAGSLWSFAPLQERDSQQHQFLYSRLFQS